MAKMYYVRTYTCFGIYDPEIGMNNILLEIDGCTVSLLGRREYVRVVDDYLVGPGRNFDDLSDSDKKNIYSRRNTFLVVSESHAVLCVKVEVPLEQVDLQSIRDSEGVVWERLPHKSKALAAFRTSTAAISLSRREGVSRDYDLIFDGYYVFEESTGGHRRFTHNNSSTGWTTSVITGKEVLEATRLSKLIHGDEAIKSVFNLFGDSQVPHENGRLHSFIAAWAGLEIFVVKKFDELLGGIKRKAKVSGMHQKLFDRMFDVMDGKYRVVDKFIILASHYDEADADKDIALFVKIKKARDDFFHTMKTGADDLPLDEVRTLLEKYLKLHLAKSKKYKSS